jgi:UDPglucose 6-dehydrogenase
MNITIIGSGYVGLVAAVCFASAGHKVICLDINKVRIKKLNKGAIPIYEPGLEEMALKSMKKKNLTFSSNVKESVQHGDVQFICVGTPETEDGSADLDYVLGAAKNIAKFMTSKKIIVNKSTVPVGSAGKVSDVIEAGLKSRAIDIDFSVVSNPEFLREGSALKDFLFPDRIIVGSSSKDTIFIMRDIYKSFIKKSTTFISMDTMSAELTKYAANALLACRISFMNEIANLSEAIGANIDEIKRGVGSDHRIGHSFLDAGCGYGGSCFPKDVAALQKIANEQAGIDLKVIKAATEVNKRQKNIIFNKISKKFKGNLQGKVIAVWGLSFKPNTDDMREAPSIDLINELILKGCRIQAYDPVAIKEAKKIFKTLSIKYKHTKEDCLKNADALAIMTEWPEFQDIESATVTGLMKQPLIFDGRNIMNIKKIHNAGIEYHPIGKSSIYPTL